jgi:hypothetical protein
MGQPPDVFSPLARDLIEQCRREIAAAWDQVAAGRRILEQSRWLLKRWGGQMRVGRLPFSAQHVSLAGGLEILPPEPRERHVQAAR